MDILCPAAVIGTNSWGGKLYGKALRGSYVTDEVILEAMKEAKRQDICLYDLARDYGLGKAQKMIGEFGTADILLSAKYTPFTHYKKGCVRKSLEKDLNDFKRSYVEVYWLHLPTDIEEHLTEIASLYKEGKIKYVGVSNFTLEECKRSKAVLEEGLLTDPRLRKKSLMKFFFNRKVKKLTPLYKAMIKVAKRRDAKVPQIAMAYCAAKGVIPMCGCRKPEQVKDLAEAVRIRLTDQEINLLETVADGLKVKIMGPDLFRPFVLKERRQG
ncbi:MAG: aldo/keto reductase [Acetatifactor sp.]|nr:aldo/keto reductase [Acetatifactor sp.]